MKFIKTGEYRPDALELPVEIDFRKAIQESTLKRLDYLLGFIKEKKPEIQPDYINKLEIKYQNLSNQNIEDSAIPVIDTITSHMVHLKNHRTLAQSVVGYQLQVLQFPQDTNWLKNQVEVTVGNNIRAHLHFRYYNLLTLIEVLGRDQAISLYKQFITNYIIANHDPERKRYDSIKSVFDEHTQPKEEVSSWVILRGMIADGKYAYRNDNCLWVEALEDLPDSELKYLVCCYGDYEGAKRYHENIVLTMEHTIAQGDPYCSRVLHDTRIDWDLRHPPKEFWDNIEFD